MHTRAKVNEMISINIDSKWVYMILNQNFDNIANKFLWSYNLWRSDRFVNCRVFSNIAEIFNASAFSTWTIPLRHHFKTFASPVANFIILPTTFASQLVICSPLWSIVMRRAYLSCSWSDKSFRFSISFRPGWVESIAFTSRNSHILHNSFYLKQIDRV